MKLKSCLSASIVCSVALASTCTAKAQLFDSFDSIDPSWTTDRRAPAGFESVFFDGDERLRLTVNGVVESAPYHTQFYLTQGRKRPVSLVEGSWLSSVDLYIGEDDLIHNRVAGLWLRAGQDGTEDGAEYPILSFRNFDPADPFNVESPNKTAVWRAWDSDTGNWYDSSLLVTAGWHTLSILFDGSQITYSVDGTEIYTDVTVGAHADRLTTVYLQSYNFGPAVGSEGGNYSVFFDNLSVIAVPEPSMAALLGIGALAIFNRKRSGISQRS